jgi:hypothetical protein
MFLFLSDGKSNTWGISREYDVLYFFWEILKQFQDKPLVGVGVKPIFRNGEVEKPIEKWTVVDYERLQRCRSH